MKKPDCKNLEKQIVELRNDHEKLVKTEQEMSKTTLYLQGVLEATGDGILVVDNDSRVILTSRRIMKTLGIKESKQDITSTDQIIQAAYQNFEQPEAYLKRVEEINRGNEHLQDTFHLKNGTIIEYYTRPLLIDGQKEGRVWSYRNITEKVSTQQALKESEKRSHNIIQSSPLGMHLYELNDAGELILVDANRAADEITGIKTSRLFGKTIEEAFPYLADSEVPERYKRAARTGESWTKTDLYYEDDQIKGAFDIEAFQISQGQMAVMFQDITSRKQTEMNLQISEEKYRKIFQNIQDVYFEIAPDLAILELSPSVSSISQYTRKDLIGRKMDELLVDPTDLNQLIARLIAEGTLKDEDVSLRDKDGRIIHCSVNLQLEKEENGDPGKIIGSLRDITERKTAREEILKLSRAVEQSPSSVVITDRSGNIEYVNPKFTRITGYTREELIGKNPRLLKSGHQPDEFYGHLWKTIGEGKEWYGEFLNRRKDGTTYWELASISPVRNNKGEITHYIGIKEDISERKKSESELKTAKEKAEESDRLKSAFLANMSHEIRTPMNAILGFSDLLQNEELSPEDMQQYIQLINTKGKELMAIISDLIDISRIEAGDMSLHKIPIQVNAFLEKVIKSFREEKAISPKSQLSIRHNFPESVSPVCLSDKNRLSQVLNNLLSNAFKFTAEGYIELGYELRDKEIIFYVRDTGIGISKDHIPIIFERFRQADDSITRKFGGTGLGLSISKQIVELLGGNLWIESAPGQGSTFYFSLPVSGITIPEVNGDKESETVYRRQELNFKGKKIIIAEDDSSNYLFMESLLRKSNAALIWAKNGQQAVDNFKKNKDTDLVIMDIRLPVKDGLLAAREIREIDDKIPIIALTAFAFTDDRAKALAAGCNEYLPKPVKPEEIIKLLNRFLGRKSPD